MLFLVLAGTLYSNILHNEFTFDDHSHLEYNVYIRSLKGVAYIAFHPIEKGDVIRAHLYRPLSFFIEYLIIKLTGLKPVSFHIANILLYALNGFLLFLVIRELFGNSIALISSVLFMVHPIHTEVTASAISITELLAFLFEMLSLLFLLKYFLLRRNIYFASLFFLLALLSKETSIIIPPIVFLLLYYKKAARKQYFQALVFYALPLLIFFALRYHVMGSFIRSAFFEFLLLDNPLVSLPFIPRLINAIYILLREIILLVCPIHLSADYSFNAIPLLDSFFSPSFLVAFAVHAGLIFLAFILIKKQFLISFSIFIFYLSVLPTSNILFPGGSMMAERFLYFAALSVCLITARGIMALQRISPFIKKISLAIFVLIAVLFTYGTWQRNTVWKDDFTLFMNVLQNYPNNAKAHLTIANIYFQKQELQTSLTYAQKAVKIYPEYFYAHLLLGRINYITGNYREAEKIFTNCIRSDPKSEVSYILLGELYFRMKDYDRARNMVISGIKNIPYSFWLQYDLAIIYINLKDYVNAETYFTNCIRMYDQGSTTPIIGKSMDELKQKLSGMSSEQAPAPLFYRVICIKYLAFIYLTQNRTGQAIELLRHNLQIKPVDKELYMLLSFALIQTANESEAKYFYQLFIAQGPADCRTSSFPDICSRLQEAFKNW